MEGLPVVPVIVQTCAWDQVEWLKGIQGHPQDGKALFSFKGDRRNQELTKIARGQVHNLAFRDPSARRALPQQPQRARNEKVIHSRHCEPSERVQARNCSLSW
jgi:hypothetical protein